MKLSKLYASLFSYTFIFIGLGIIIEFLFIQNPDFSYIKTPTRYFYWAFNGINLSHLLLLVIYRKDKNETSRSRIFFFAVVNHFLTCLITVGLYALVWYGGSKVEGLIAVTLYIVTFVFFMGIMLWQGKK